MASLQVLLVVFSLGCVVVVSPSDVTSGITYDCLPDGIIHIHGIPKEYSVTVLSGGSSCHVSQIAAHDFALSRYCAIGVYQGYPYYKTVFHADIQLSHSSSHVIGGNGVNPFRLKCDKVHSGGQTFELVTSFYVRDRRTDRSIPTLPSRKSMDNRAPYNTSPRMTFLNEFLNNTEYHRLFPGSLIYLRIESGSLHHVIRPENCTALQYHPMYSSGGDSVDLWDVSKDKCVLEPYLMEKFTSNDDQSEVTAPVYAFHFGHRDTYFGQGVYIECTVRVCSRGSFSCSLDVCDDVRREGRSAEEEDDDYEHHLVTGKLTIEQVYASGSDRGRSSISTSLLGVLALALYRKCL